VDAPLIAAAVADVPTETTVIVTPIVPTPAPTTDPALDHLPPIPLVEALPLFSPANFTVHWGGQDDSGIASYIVWVRVNGGTWQKWLETSDVAAEYAGTPGNAYEFALWAVDLAGNWSQNVDLLPQAATIVQ
jgi:hypothetical protein